MSCELGSLFFQNLVWQPVGGISDSYQHLLTRWWLLAQIVSCIFVICRRGLRHFQRIVIFISEEERKKKHYHASRHGNAYISPSPTSSPLCSSSHRPVHLCPPLGIWIYLTIKARHMPVSGVKKKRKFCGYLLLFFPSVFFLFFFLRKERIFLSGVWLLRSNVFLSFAFNDLGSGLSIWQGFPPTTWDSRSARFELYKRRCCSAAGIVL